MFALATQHTPVLWGKAMDALSGAVKWPTSSSDIAARLRCWKASWHGMLVKHFTWEYPRVATQEPPQAQSTAWHLHAQHLLQLLQALSALAEAELDRRYVCDC